MVKSSVVKRPPVVKGPCPLCTRPEGPNIIWALTERSRSEAERQSGLPHSTFVKYTKHHNALMVSDPLHCASPVKPTGPVTSRPYTGPQTPRKPKEKIPDTDLDGIPGVLSTIVGVIKHHVERLRAKSTRVATLPPADIKTMIAYGYFLCQVHKDHRQEVLQTEKEARNMSTEELSRLAAAELPS